jgi:hypothetical protein
LISARFFFNENITLGNILGAIVIMVGVSLMAVNSKSKAQKKPTNKRVPKILKNFFGSRTTNKMKNS